VSPKIVYAVATVTVGMQTVRAGTHWRADDPLVLSQPSLFSEDPAYGMNSSIPFDAYPSEKEPREHPPVEQMTAEPGERRNVRVPRSGRG
jgi:hypothetical protein